MKATHVSGVRYFRRTHMVNETQSVFDIVLYSTVMEHIPN